jgi:PHD/YefM family antitoxin component YafN of YafNO toxin-antitoxin module
MVTVHPEYVIDEKQHRKAVLLPVSDWERILEELEELDDIRAFDEAKSKEQETVPFEQAVREIRESYE